MRKTEHLHALLQVLGFRGPRQFFHNGDFVHLFRQVWSYVASVSFTSQEACALHLCPSQGLGFLRGEPLMPALPSQLAKVGHEGGKEYLSRQREARALDSETAATTVVPSFPSWTPASYGDATLNAEEWGQHAVRDCNAGSIKNSNHICRPRTCYKGRWAKRRFCRMFYWRWARVRNQKGVEVARRMHGCALARRWDGKGLPPVVATPPNRGAPELERSHGFHGKVVPGILLGPRCNHDLRNLLHLLVLSEDLRSKLLSRYAESNQLGASLSGCHGVQNVGPACSGAVEGRDEHPMACCEEDEHMAP